MRRLKQRWRLEPRILITTVRVVVVVPGRQLQELRPVAVLAAPAVVVILVERALLLLRLLLRLDRQIFAKILL